MARDQAKNEPNYEYWNIKLEILGGEREKEGLPALHWPKIPKIISRIIDTNYNVKYIRWPQIIESQCTCMSVYNGKSRSLVWLNCERLLAHHYQRKSIPEKQKQKQKKKRGKKWKTKNIQGHHLHSYISRCVINGQRQEPTSLVYSQ